MIDRLRLMEDVRNHQRKLEEGRRESKEAGKIPEMESALEKWKREQQAKKQEEYQLSRNNYGDSDDSNRMTTSYKKSRAPDSSLFMWLGVMGVILIGSCCYGCYYRNKSREAPYVAPYAPQITLTPHPGLNDQRRDHQEYEPFQPQPTFFSPTAPPVTANNATGFTQLHHNDNDDNPPPYDYVMQSGDTGYASKKSKISGPK